MMRVLTVIGDVFGALGLALAAFAGWLAMSGHDMTRAAGKLWFTLDSASLNSFQAIVQRYVHPGLWDNVMVPLLLRPTWEAIGILVVVLVAIGIALSFLSRKWLRNRRFKQMKVRAA